MRLKNVPGAKGRPEEILAALGIAALLLAAGGVFLLPHMSSALEAWQGEPLRRLRELHAQARWAEHPLCAKCDEFHRP